MSATIADAAHMAGAMEDVVIKVSRPEMCGHFLAGMIFNDFDVASKTAADVAYHLLMMCGEVVAANSLKSYVARCSKA